MTKAEKAAIRETVQWLRQHLAGGTCAKCQAKGIAWDTPTETGLCYECHEKLE